MCYKLHFLQNDQGLFYYWSQQNLLSKAFRFFHFKFFMSLPCLTVKVSLCFEENDGGIEKYVLL